MKQQTMNQNAKGTQSRKIFTLIELLVVIAIIAILAAMLLPALNQARNRAKAAGCVSNFKQIGSAIQSYVGDYSGWLPKGSTSGEQAPWGWKMELASYVGMANSLLEMRNGAIDATRSGVWNGVFRCPAFTMDTGATDFLTLGRYGGGTGWNSSMGGNTTRYKANRMNKPSETVLAGDGSDVDVNGTQPYRCSIVYRPYNASSGDLLAYIGVRHSQGINVAWGDGHVSHAAKNMLAKGNGLGGWAGENYYYFIQK